MVIQIIFFACFYPIFALLYFNYKAEGEIKKEYAFGVNIREGWRELPELKEILLSYKKKLKIAAVVMGLVPFSTFFIPYFSISYSIWMLWLLVIIGVPFILFAHANKAVKAVKMAKEPGFREEEDNSWIFGMFYYNPKDKHTMVTKRVGIGVTTNMATPVGKALDIIGAIALLLIPVMCVWMMLEEFMPIHLMLDQRTVVAKHITIDYEIPLSQVEGCSLIYELPSWSKTTGTAMERLEKGNFFIRNEGKCEVFLNPKNAVFIKFTAEDITYYMGGYDNEETVRIYEQIRGQT